MAELNIAQFVERPPRRWYEVRTVHGAAYQAEGDVIESGDGWFTLWADGLTIALRVPEADVRAVRQVTGGELEAEASAPDERERKESEAALVKLRHLGEQLQEARQWARHGYEIGQRHCGWTDHGVAPDWLTEGWPHNFEACEHLKQAAEYDTALSRVLQVADDLEGVEAHGGA